jgi:hypothetical protein
MLGSSTVLRPAGPFGHPTFARRRRVRGATPTRLPDSQSKPSSPFAHPVPNFSPQHSRNSSLDGSIAEPPSGGVCLTRRAASLILDTCKTHSPSSSAPASDTRAQTAPAKKRGSTGTSLAKSPRSIGLTSTGNSCPVAHPHASRWSWNRSRWAPPVPGTLDSTSGRAIRISLSSPGDGESEARLRLASRTSSVATSCRNPHPVSDPRCRTPAHCNAQ